MSKKILVVDDEPDSLQLINDFLVREGYETILIESGLEALELLPQVHPDLVILDVVMPDINGLDVIRKIRRNPATHKAKVVMVSALGTGIKLMLRDSEQANYYMSKPFSGKELLRVVDDLLSQAEAVSCWVNYNEIRGEARIHLEDCIHCNPTDNSKGSSWRHYSSIEDAERDYEKKYSDYSWSRCKVCLRDNDED